jgi:hypothetical protein
MTDDDENLRLRVEQLQRRVEQLEQIEQQLENQMALNREILRDPARYAARYQEVAVLTGDPLTHIVTVTPTMVRFIAKQPEET